ncbi:TPA: restriction endonuclease subunit S [Serratia marcescens]|nr:restriction endonuclease subunit S [Serratia marcescens]
MNSNPPVRLLSEIVTIKGGKRLPVGKNLQSLPSEHPYIRVRDVGQRNLPREGIEYVPDDVFPSISRYIVQENDVVLSIVGTIGALSIVDNFYDYASLTENCVKLTGLDYHDALYLYYYLLSSLGQQEISQGTVGAVQPKLPIYNIEKIKVLWPDDKDRRKNIASVLGKLDDKIDLNRHINQTLEAIAQAIFKSWFVDFDPVKAKIAAIEQGEDPLRAAMRAISGKTDAELDQMPREQYDQLAATASLFPDAMEGSVLGEIPLRWKVVPASTLIEFNPKELLRKGTVAPYLDMASLPTSGSWAEPPVPREFGSGMRFRNGDALLARITPCLENGKSAFVQNLPDETVGWGSTEFIVMRSKNPVPREYAYLLVRHAAFREHAIRSMTGTSGRQRAQADAVAEFKVVSPSENSVWFAFARLLDSCFKVIKSQSEAVEKLAELRDILLPQLLSGELIAPSDFNGGESQ